MAVQIDFYLSSLGGQYRLGVAVPFSRWSISCFDRICHAGPARRAGAFSGSAVFLGYIVSGTWLSQCLPVHLLICGGSFLVPCKSCCCDSSGGHTYEPNKSDAGKPGCHRPGEYNSDTGRSNMAQSRMYRDPETLYRETIDRNPSCWMAHNNFGNVLRLPGRSGDAIQEYEAQYESNWTMQKAHYNLANLLFKDDLPDAIAHYQAAIRDKPDFAEAHANLGTALARVPGRLTDAITEYQAAIRLKPEIAVTHFDFANTLSQSADRLPEAISEYRKAIELDSDNLEAHYNLGNILAKDNGHLVDAIAEYQAALRIKPDFLEGRISLGSVLGRIPDRLPDAIAEDEAALRLDPESERAHYNLGVALAKVPGRSREAIAHLEFVLRVRPDVAPARQLIERLRASER